MKALGYLRKNLFSALACFFGRLAVVILIAGLAASLGAQAVRTEVWLPDLPGYTTLKCDFHMHTVFSDGSVWPPLRVEEAWREGYDVIAISDHLEYLPHRQDLNLTNYSRPYELARPTADSLGLLLIPAAELTRGEPPGHWNLLFLTDANAIPTNDHRAALRAAREQGAFVFWNHPGWKLPRGKSKWYDEQQEAFTNGWLHGLEIVNGLDYDPIAHQWCLDKQLTLLGNSDLHDTTAMDYAFPPGSRRPMTLVFARKKTLPAVKEALLQRRTAVYAQNLIFGDEQYLRPLFEESIVVKTPKLNLALRGRAVLQIQNRCAVDFELKAAGKISGLIFPEKLILYAGKTLAVTVRRNTVELASGTQLGLPYEVTNLKTAPNKALSAQIAFTLLTEKRND